MSEEWQTMESAPRDGTAVWLWSNGGTYLGYCEPADGFLTPHDAWFLKVVVIRRPDTNCRHHDDILGCYAPRAKPDYWQPLPAPPGATK